jgi:hypothetical protein
MPLALMIASCSDSASLSGTESLSSFNADLWVVARPKSPSLISSPSATNMFAGLRSLSHSK